MPTLFKTIIVLVLAVAFSALIYLSFANNNLAHNPTPKLSTTQTKKFNTIDQSPVQATAGPVSNSKMVIYNSGDDQGHEPDPALNLAPHAIEELLTATETQDIIALAPHVRAWEAATRGKAAAERRARYDLNQDGMIDIDQKAAWQANEKEWRQQRYQECVVKIWAKYDTNQDGALEATELDSILKHYRQVSANPMVAWAKNYTADLKIIDDGDRVRNEGELLVSLSFEELANRVDKIPGKIIPDMLRKP